MTKTTNETTIVLQPNLIIEKTTYKQLVEISKFLNSTPGELISNLLNSPDFKDTLNFATKHIKSYKRIAGGVHNVNNNR